MLLHLPDAFLRSVTAFDLPAAGSYAVGMGFLRPTPANVPSPKKSWKPWPPRKTSRVLGGARYRQRRRARRLCPQGD
ncbi:hypothetical protein, partial [Glutamicibacter nicotianae]|uniref:hypothetical protein n=1 Tax=Glutamicibacter nicotianae TaxID=37929 RepID=UPI0031D923AA